MNKSLQQLAGIAANMDKKVIGLMSGTSLDGLDIALCRIRGSGAETRAELLEFMTVNYPDHLTEELNQISFRREISLEDLCVLHTSLGRYYADLVMEALGQWGMDPGEVDLIASHGQTVYHAPAFMHKREGKPNATLQIGDGDQIARKTGILTVSDFRQKHTAAGGEGAPITSVVDRLLFRHRSEDRIILNIGGIANFTYLPSSAADDRRSVTTDTGPGNTLINAAVQRAFGQPFDRDGSIASTGQIDPELYRELKKHPFFKRSLPKSTGPEMFNLEWVDDQVRNAGITQPDPGDLVATLTWLSAETIADAIRSLDVEQLPAIYLCGGGMYNKQLTGWLQELLEEYTIQSFEEIGFLPDAREAVSFAILANETLSGGACTIHPIKGTERLVNFGKISLPV